MSSHYNPDVGWIGEHLVSIESIIRAVGGIGTTRWFDYDNAMSEGDLDEMLDSFNDIMDENNRSIRLSMASIPLEQSISIINGFETPDKGEPDDVLTVSTDFIWRKAGRILNADDMRILVDAVDALEEMHAYADIENIIQWISQQEERC